MLKKIVLRLGFCFPPVAEPLHAKWGHLRQKVRAVRYLSTEAAPKVEEDIVPAKFIRNFCIIAHVDHGKSTLADRILELTGAISKDENNKQVLDRLPVEKERGITVKAVTASLTYTYKGSEYILNLIDTPGHVDFSSEVRRSLYACQGVILLVDANKGIQAQTVANFYSAFALDLNMIPVLNKIDLPQADPEGVERELQTLFGFEKSSVLRISAKTGLGVDNLLKAIVEKFPPPKVSEGPFKAHVIDSWYDKQKGSILFIYIASGLVRKGDVIISCKKKKKYTVKATALLTPEEKPIGCLHAGRVGILSCGIKEPNPDLIGDTVHSANVQVEPLQSFDAMKPMVFAGLYPKTQEQHESLKAALEKLCLNDPSVTVARENSPALGYGWRLGFLGLLHLDVFRQRLEQEYDAEAILTAPSVTYRVKIKGQKNIKEYRGEIIEVKNPAHFPDESIIAETFEPIILATIITPIKYQEDILELCVSRRGIDEGSTNLDKSRIMLRFTFPLSEILFDFHDKLKSLSSGYASFDYEEKGYVSAPLKRLLILLNGRQVEELITIVHEDRVQLIANKLVTKLEELIPRQQIEIAIQAAVQGKIIARRTIKPYRKDVTAKVYGGDITRKMKLLRNQREGKKKMRMFANIQIERDTFVDVLKEK